MHFKNENFFIKIISFDKNINDFKINLEDSSFTSMS